MLRRLALFTLAALACVQAADPMLEKADLWTGGEAGYKRYRIPGIVATARGTVLAYAEARRNTGGDWDTIDIVMRRSTDGGRTFSPQRVVARVMGAMPRNPVAIERRQGGPDDHTYNNPAAVADRSGAVHFLFCVEYMRVFYMRSDDDGQTFSAPREITSALDLFRPEYAWRVVATGPGHGIQLRNGRLLMPVWLSLGNGGNGHHPSVAATIFSDDHGQSWHRGAIALRSTTGFPDPNETTAVQLADGRVMLNIRTEAPQNRRAVVIGKNGATGWSKPRLAEDLPDPICFGSLARLSTRRGGGRNRLLFSNPDNLTRADGRDVVAKDRRDLTIRLSYDEGRSWPVKRVIEPGPAAYSDLAVLPDGTILCLYEASGRLVLARFNLEWLSGGRDALGS